MSTSHRPLAQAHLTGTAQAGLAEARYVLPSFVERTAYHTGQPIERIEEDADRDRWFTATEAKEYGFVDQVIRSAVEVPTEGVVS